MKLKKIEFARLVGINPATVTKFLKKGILLGTEDGFIDIEGEPNKSYIQKRQRGETNFLQGKPAVLGVHYIKAAQEVAKAKREKVELKKELVKSLVENKTKGELKKEITQINTKNDFIVNARSKYSEHSAKTQLELAKLEMDIEAKELDLLQKKGNLIDRDRTLNFLFLHIDLLHKNLLGMPLQIADRIIALVQSDKGNVKKAVVEYLTGNISRELKKTKSEVIKTDKELQDTL